MGTVLKISAKGGLENNSRFRELGTYHNMRLFLLLLKSSSFILLHTELNNKPITKQILKEVGISASGNVNDKAVPVLN
jgi:hypothetical protein